MGYNIYSPFSNPMKPPRLSDIERVNQEISNLRLFAVYDFFRSEIVFTSQDISKCKRFVRDYGERVTNIMEQFYIVRFDPYDY